MELSAGAKARIKLARSAAHRTAQGAAAVINLEAKIVDRLISRWAAPWHPQGASRAALACAAIAHMRAAGQTAACAVMAGCVSSAARLPGSTCRVSG